MKVTEAYYAKSVATRKVRLERLVILARILLESNDTELSPEAARYLLSIKLPSRDEDRLNELSAKARAGTLTEPEQQELDSYLRIGTLLEVLKQ